MSKHLINGYWVTLRDGRIVGRERAVSAAMPKPKATAKKITRTAPRGRSGLTFQTFAHLLPPQAEIDAHTEGQRIATSLAHDVQLVDPNPEATAKQIVKAAAKARRPTGGPLPARGTMARAIIDAGKKRRGEI